MAQWTNNRQAFQAIVKLACDHILVPDVTITLIDQRQFRGTIVGMDTGNDAGNHNPSIPQTYYGSVRLDATDNVYVIDLALVQNIS